MKIRYRIKDTREFREIMSKRKVIQQGPFLLYVNPRKEDHGRIGLSVSKKIGNAVVRNKCKRQLRMMLLEVHDFESCPFDGVLILKSSYLKQSYEENKKLLESLLKTVTMR